jgi:hypothetical protein
MGGMGLLVTSTIGAYKNWYSREHFPHVVGFILTGIGLTGLYKIYV